MIADIYCSGTAFLYKSPETCVLFMTSYRKATYLPAVFISQRFLNLIETCVVRGGTDRQALLSISILLLGDLEPPPVRNVILIRGALKPMYCGWVWNPCFQGKWYRLTNITVTGLTVVDAPARRCALYQCHVERFHDSLRCLAIIGNDIDWIRPGCPYSTIWLRSRLQNRPIRVFMVLVRLNRVYASTKMSEL